MYPVSRLQPEDHPVHKYLMLAVVIFGRLGIPRARSASRLTGLPAQPVEPLKVPIIDKRNLTLR
jgi:hypothetical protein